MKREPIEGPDMSPRDKGSVRRGGLGYSGVPSLVALDIGHVEYSAVIEPDLAFWSLVRTRDLADVIDDPSFLGQIQEHSVEFADEMHLLRSGLTPLGPSCPFTGCVA